MSILKRYDVATSGWIPVAVGAPGQYGATGATGAIGLSGTTGATGASGLSGTTGATGASGLRGSTGSTGATGASGLSGTTGATGASGFAGTTGATGASGLSGTTGATGASGLSGTTGATGASGLRGSTGSTGATGASGFAGTTGATGASGFVGTTGATGATGASGLSGTTGATGASGFVGTTGATGATGASGLSGTTGATGASGLSGTTGATGASGLRGSTGSTGATGASGFAGTTGATGASGFVGTTGATGATGASGLSGTTGATGASGLSGTTGATGLTGATGASGLVGTTGLTGATGAGSALTGGVANHLAFWTSASGLGYDTSLKYASGTKTLTFTGTGVAASGINLNILTDSTLSFESTAGQLFSISDGLASGTIFSVNDISGMSSLEIDASGLVKIGEYDGFLGIGTSQPYSQYTGKVEINYPSGAYKGLIIRPAAGGTGNIFEAQSSVSGVLVVIDASGEFGINNSAPGAMLDVVSRASTIKGAIVKGAASQSANLLEVQNSSSTVLHSIDPSGNTNFGDGLVSRFSANTVPVSSARNLAQTDNGASIVSTSTSGITLTIPSGLAIGFNCSVLQKGSGQVTVGSGAGVSAYAPDGAKSAKQWAVMTVLNTGTSNEYVVGGNVTT
jgi:hypothetical protein